MGQFRAEGFVEQDNLEFEPLSGTIRCKGEISCLGDIVIAVDKLLEVLDGDRDPDVQTFLYAYNASVRGAGSFLRHDNAHAHPGHEDAHHRHVFDWQTGEEMRPPEWCGEEKWPTLGEFIGKVRDWYYSHSQELPNPNTFAAIGTRAGTKAAR